MLRRFPILEIIGLMITAALALIWLYPLLWAIDTSIKQEFQTIEPIPSWLPIRQPSKRMPRYYWAGG